jgi:DNA-binding CsgD family transcriptional regulator
MIPNYSEAAFGGVAILPFGKRDFSKAGKFERLQAKCPKRKKRAPRRFSCRACKGFPGCGELCEKAEGYAAQDEVSQREETIGVPVITETANLSISPPVKLTRREREIVTLTSVHKFSRAEVAKYLKISRESLRVHLARIRRKIPSGKESEAES